MLVWEGNPEVPRFVTPFKKSDVGALVVKLRNLRQVHKNISGIGLRPEVELLLCSARTHIGPQTAARIRALVSQATDWRYLIAAGNSHGVLPLLYRALSQVCPDAVPAAKLEFLKVFYEFNERRNLSLMFELLRLLNALAERGVCAVPFKGPVLAASIYGDLALRQFTDLDILVHKRDILRAKDALLSEGYRPRGSANDSGSGSDCLDPNLDSDRSAPLSPNFYTFMRDDGKIIVDLQWRITERLFSFSPESELLWNHLERFQVRETSVITFSPKALLLILCAHGCKHVWEKLKWVCDVAQTIAVISGKDRATVLEHTLINGNRRMVATGLLLAHELLGATLPDDLVKNIRSDRVVTSVATQVCRRLFADADKSLGESKKFIFYLRTKESWAQRMHYCFQYLSRYLDSIFSPTSLERELLPLPEGLAFLHYGFRPLRLAGKYALRPFKRAH